MTEAVAETVEQDTDPEGTEIDISVRLAIKRVYRATFDDDVMLGFFLLGGACLGVVSLMRIHGVGYWPLALLAGPFFFATGQFFYVCGLQRVREEGDQPDGLGGILWAGAARSVLWVLLIGFYLVGLAITLYALPRAPSLAAFLGFGMAYLGLYLFPTVVGVAVRPADRPQDRNTVRDIVSDNRGEFFKLFGLVWLASTPLSFAASFMDLFGIVATPLLGLVNGIALAALGDMYLQGL